MIKIKFKITLQRIFAYLYILVILIIIVSLSFAAYFLYNDFYLTITQSQEIIDLERQVADEKVNMEKFNTVIKKIEEKNKMQEVVNINNPFD